jgi:predicted permease
MSTLRFALRLMLRQKAFSLTAAFSLALGIGLVATQFSVIDGILLRGLPVPDAQRIVHVARTPPASESPGDWQSVPYRDYLEFRQRQTVLESVAGMSVLGLNLTGPGRVPIHHAGALVSANLLDVLGLKPALGRWFTAEEDQPGRPLLIVLSHPLWQDEFAADPGVLGRALTVNGEVGTIIGVMPPRFTFPAQMRLWLNLRAAPTDPRIRRIDYAEMIGKLRPGVTLEQANAEFSAIAATLARTYPETNQGFERMIVQKLTFAYAGTGTQPILYLMLAMTVFILALACVNVANMLLGRAAQRTRELAVRAAVGANRARLVRQLLGEALLLAGCGAIGGLVMAQLGVDLLQKYLVDEGSVPGWFAFRLDHRVVGIAVLGTLAAGVLAGIMPALQASRVDVNTALKDDARAASSMGLGRVARWLVTAQVAFSSALLVAACVLGWTVYETRQASSRFDPDHLLTGRVELHEATHATPEQRAQFYRELLSRLETLPGVEAVAVTSRNFIGNGVGTQVAPEGAVYKHDNDRPIVWLEVVSEGYFKLAGVPAISGRLFDSREQNPTMRTAVINEAFARKFWPGEDPVGRRFRTEQTSDAWITVVGVVPNLKMQGAFQPAGRNEEGFYLSQDQMGWGWLDLFIRTKTDPLQFVPAVRQAIVNVDPNQPIHSVGTLTSVTARAIRGFNILGVMAAIFASVTLFLGAVGVYGVTALAVRRRTREFGIRMALGATVGQVLRSVLGQGGRQIALGLSAGLGAGYLLTRPLETVFGRAATNNALIYLVVASVIALVGLAALWLPAARAAHIDPMEALRTE